MSSDLTNTETNSSDESKGRTYGLDGDLFVVAVVTLFVTITSFTLLFTIFAWGWLPAFIVVGLPAGLVYGWVFGLKQGRPTGYDVDWFEQLTMGTAAYLLINGFVRQNLITRPRQERKRLIFEEAARTLGAKGGPQIVEESYTGLRKFGVWVFAIVQQYALFERSPIRAPVMNNSKNFFIMRQMDVKDVANIAKDTQLPETSQRAVMDFPLPEYLPAHDKHSSVCYYVPSAHPPVCGNIKNYVSPEMVYVSSSDGEIYDKRMKQLAKHSNPIEGILHESKQT